jgi:cytochrome c biogenesis protein CcmG, thiol:disulfide interchange protein DsbE
MSARRVLGFAARMKKTVLVMSVAMVALTSCMVKEDAGSDSATSTSRRVEIGQVVPAYGATALTGGADSLEALRGKVVLLNVWATWCIPCRTELPDLQALHERYRAQGLEIVGVSIDDASGANDVTEYAKERGVSYTLWHDPDDRISGLFLANGVPATYLIGRNGTLRWRWLGPLTKDDVALNGELTKALEEN